MVEQQCEMEGCTHQQSHQPKLSLLYDTGERTSICSDCHKKAIAENPDVERAMRLVN